jgi:predicted nucleic acid-binding protein
MIILDTNVVSALMRPTANREVASWLDRQPRLSIWTTAITVLEAEYGLEIMPAGRRRDAPVDE